MAAPDRPAATPAEQAHTVADHLRGKDKGALTELHNDVRGMKPEEQQQFFRQLATEAKNSPNHKLPGLEITDDKKGGFQVKDKSGVLYNEAAKPGKTEVPTKPGKPEVPAKPGKPEAPSDPNKGNDQFSPGLKKGEGPYQALHRQHPDWNHKQLMDEAHKIKEQTGNKSFKVGEQFKSNPDGSVTSREDSKKNDGSYTETTSKDGHKNSVKTGDNKGNWTENKFDPSGKSTGSVEHKVGEDGSYKETEKNAEGKVTRDVNADKNGKNTNTYDKDGNQVSAIRENNDGSSVGWNKNPDGTQTNFEQKDKDHRDETITKDGEVIGKRTMVKDDKGMNTNTFDKDGTQTSGMRQNNDGSSTGWKKNADGSTTTIDTNPQGLASEATFDQSGNMLSSAERNTKTGEYSEKTYQNGKVTLKTHNKGADGKFG